MDAAKTYAPRKPNSIVAQGSTGFIKLYGFQRITVHATASVAVHRNTGN